MGSLVTGEDEGVLDQAELARERRRFASHAWLYKGERRLEQSRKARFDWGSVHVDLTCENGVIRDLMVFSDGLEAERIDAIPQLLVGSRCVVEELEQRLREGGLPCAMASDIACLVAGQAGR